jgi:hypothetical protein
MTDSVSQGNLEVFSIRTLRAGFLVGQLENVFYPWPQFVHAEFLSRPNCYRN